MAADFSTNKGHIILAAYNADGNIEILIEILEEAIIDDYPVLLIGKSWCGEFKERESEA